MIHEDLTLRGAVQDGIVRAIGALGLAGIGLIHLLDAPSKYTETRYMFWMYIALILGTIVVGGALIRYGSRKTWLAAAVLATAPLVGFVLTRTTGLPQANGDIGNWTEGIGLSSLWVEGCVIVLSGAVLIWHGRSVPAVTN